MKKLSEILPKVMAKRDLDENALSSEILRTAEKHLEDVFGEKNVGQGRAIHGKKIQHGLIFFQIPSSAWNHRLYLEKMELLDSLRMKFPKVVLKDIRGIVCGSEETEII